MALVLVDGKEISVGKGETLLQACLRENVYIPYFCYHPSLSLVGQCRMCLVKIEGAPKLTTACTTTVGELPPEKKMDGRYDMKVSVACDEVKEAQRGVMEFLLTNHPLDCPICDQAGECQLQEYSYTYGAPRSEFVFEKLHAPKRVDLGPHVVYDAERCIKCTRCVRFCSEITGTNELTLVERGAHAYIETFDGARLDNDYSVCVADICPVGALTYREFRFKERVWFLQAANSVCPECSRNCSVRVDSCKGDILRLVPRFNPAVNGHYMCDHGRLVSERLRNRDLRETPSIRKDGRLRTVREEEFFAAASKLFAKRKYGPSDVAVVLSGRMTLEEMVAYKALSREWFGGMAGEALLVEGRDDSLLIRAEKRPNLEGARRVGISVAARGRRLTDYLKGRKALIVIREDIISDAPSGEADELAAAISAIETVLVMDDHLSKTAALAGYFMPLAGWFEMEGTTVNFKGHIQKTARCVTPPGGRKPFHECVNQFLKAAGKESPKGFGAWFEEVKKELPMLELIKVRDLVPGGVPLPVVKDGND